MASYTALLRSHKQCWLDCANSTYCATLHMAKCLQAKCLTHAYAAQESHAPDTCLCLRVSRSTQCLRTLMIAYERQSYYEPRRHPLLGTVRNGAEICPSFERFRATIRRSHHTLRQTYVKHRFRSLENYGKHYAPQAGFLLRSVSEALVPQGFRHYQTLTESIRNC